MTEKNSEVSTKSKTEVLGKITTKKKIFIGSILGILILIPGSVFFADNVNYYLHMLLYTFMFIALASSWNMIGGYTGYTSLGHTVFLAIGGYLSGIAYLKFGISPFITAPLAGLLSVAFGFFFGLISLRTSGASFIISSTAMVLLFKISLDHWDYGGGTGGMYLPFLKIPLEYSKIPFYYAMLLIAVGAVYMSYRVRHSKFGLGLRAISQDEIKAEAAGIPTKQYKILAFALSGFFVGVAGSMWGFYLTYLRPSIFLTILLGAHMVLMSVLGGKGTVSGPVVGAILFIGINEFFVTKLGSSELNIVATGVLLAVVLLFFPAGIVGSLKARGKLPEVLDWD